MLTTILGLFSSFNPVIVGLLLGTGAYIALRHRTVPSVGQVAGRIGAAASLLIRRPKALARG